MSRRLPVADAAALFQLLGEPTRLRLLLALSRHEELSVGRLVEAVAQPQPAVSKHLQLLRFGGVVEARRDGHHIFYRLTSPLVAELLRDVRARPGAGPAPEAKPRARSAR